MVIYSCIHENLPQLTITTTYTDRFDTIPPLVMLILTVNIYSENYDRIIVNIYAWIIVNI